ncbi:MAG: GMC family oxidoreductase [Spirochaetia bacterium]|nr:MAG: GMC family oxidoreductase [Spirochaetia bacterium]
MLREGITGLADTTHDLCIVGSGPVGLALASDLARRGQRVLVLESGTRKSDPQIQLLSAADILDPSSHEDMAIAVARRLGGTSNLWGARCIPFDPIDFEDRDWINARWPIGYNDMAPWLPAAVDVTQSGAPVYREAIPSFVPSDTSFQCDALERWANIQPAQVIHSDTIEHDTNIDLRTLATVTGIEFAENGCVEAVIVAHSLSGATSRVPVRQLVIATGGLEATRLLLAAQADESSRFGGENGPLGRYYMGHLCSEIADITLNNRLDEAFDFHIDAYGSYVRRRLAAAPETQREHRLLNTTFWPIVPPIADSGHGSAILSLVYMAMRIGPLGRLLVAETIRRKQAPAASIFPHIGNLVTGLPQATHFGIDFLRRRYLGTARVPGFFVHNRAHRYGLTFHAEQAPNAESRVKLIDRRDRLGLPQLRIDYRFSTQDIDSVVRSHDLLEGWLARTGMGRINYRVPRDARGEAVAAQCTHGTHHIGLSRMAADRRNGVVNGDLQTFDAPNLYIASTSVLPTSGQANPTLTAIALALRLSARLAAGTAQPLAVRGKVVKEK